MRMATKTTEAKRGRDLPGRGGGGGANKFTVLQNKGRQSSAFKGSRFLLQGAGSSIRSFSAKIWIYI